jgi:hypothetical protein
MDFQNPPVFAHVCPATDRTWEGSAILRGNRQETGRIPIAFTRPVLVVAIYPSLSVVVQPNPALPIPTLDDLRVYLDISANERLTSRFDTTTTPNTEAGQFVTLGAFRDTTGGARLFMRMINEPSPVVGLNFQWKRDVTGGPYFADVEVSLALHCLYLDSNGKPIS